MQGQREDADDAVGRSVFPLRPLGVAEVLDAAVTVTRAYPKATLGPALVVYGGASALLFGLTAIVTAVLYASDNSFLQALAIGAGAAGFTASSVVGDAFVIVVTALFGTLAAGVVMRALLGRPAGPRDVWRDTRRSFGWTCLYALMLMFAALVPFVGTLLATFLAAVSTVGIYLYAAALIAIAGATTFLLAQVWLAPTAIVCERLDVIRAIGRSWRLASGGRWRATGVLALTALIGLLLWAAITAGVLSLLGIVAEVLSATFSGDLVTGGVVASGFLGGIIVGTLVTPFLSVVASVAYFDQRMRTEGFDITLTQIRTAGGLRRLAVTATLVGPGTPFAAPDDRRPPEPPPGFRHVPPVPVRVPAPPVPPAPPMPPRTRVGG